YGVVSLGAHCAGELASWVVVRGDAFEDGPEVALRCPPELEPGTGVVVNPIELRHEPSPLRTVYLVHLGEQSAYHRGDVVAEFGDVAVAERCGRADDVAAETQLRRPLCRQQVCVDNVGEVDAAVQELVGFDVPIGVTGTDVVAVVEFREEPGGA